MKDAHGDPRRHHPALHELEQRQPVNVFAGEVQLRPLVHQTQHLAHGGVRQGLQLPGNLGQRLNL